MRADEIKRLAGLIKVPDTGVSYTDEAAFGKLAGYMELLAKWGTKMDLVSSTEPERILHEHILDSVAVAMVVGPALQGEEHKLQFTNPGPLVDIGSGAGLPGVVLAILNPQRPVFLVEPRAKRTEFLKECRRALVLENIEVLMARLEGAIKQLPPVFHATQRAVGLEVENQRLLTNNFPGSLLSFVVSEQWRIADAVSTDEVDDAAYELPSGRRGRVVTVRC
jgi:16S rRNA (guanine(527)-N(7))-methyltransferase RsmG